MIIHPKADSLTSLRIKKGLSQRELAKKAGLSHCHLSQIENNHRYPSPRTAQKICQALGCDFDDLFEIVTDEESLAG
jgi:transcriptional regulator with XRE-family HTH domain